LIDGPAICNLGSLSRRLNLTLLLFFARLDTSLQGTERISAAVTRCFWRESYRAGLHYFTLSLVIYVARHYFTALFQLNFPEIINSCLYEKLLLAEFAAAT
jgi:hypothetical protein